MLYAKAIVEKMFQMVDDGRECELDDMFENALTTKQRDIFQLMREKEAECNNIEKFQKINDIIKTRRREAMLIIELKTIILGYKQA